MQYKLTYDVSNCSKEVKRDFNIDSIMSDDDLTFEKLEEFKSYVELLKDIESDRSDITINNIDFKIDDIKYSIHDNITFCIISLYVEEVDEYDNNNDGSDYMNSPMKIDSLIQAYIKAGSSSI